MASSIMREGQDLMDRAAERVWQALKSTAQPQAWRRSPSARRKSLSRFFYEETGRKPMVIAIVTPESSRWLKTNAGAADRRLPLFV